MDKSIFQDSSTIQISVMKVGTKKLTSSLLDQFEIDFPFDSHLNFTGDAIFGFVKRKRIPNQPLNLTVVAQKDGKLIKFQWDRLHNISFLNKTTKWHEARNSSLRFIIAAVGEETINRFEREIEYYEGETIEELFDEEELNKILDLGKLAKEYLDEIFERQIYI